MEGTYRYDLVLTRAGGYHVYRVFRPTERGTGEPLGLVESVRVGRRTEWRIEGPNLDKPVSRTFKTRQTASDVLAAFARQVRLAAG